MANIGGMEAESGTHWYDVIAEMEKLPPGEGMKVDLDDGSDIQVLHVQDGRVRVRMGGSAWFDYTLREVAQLIRDGVAGRAQA